MYEQNTKEVIELFDAMMQHGKEPSRFVFDMIYFMRDLLFYKTTPELEHFLERAIVTDQFEQLAAKVETEWIEHAIVQLTECEQRLKWTTSPKVFVEVTLIAITNRHEQSGDTSPQQLADAAMWTKLENRIKALENKLTEFEQLPRKQTEMNISRNKLHATYKKNI